MFSSAHNVPAPLFISSRLMAAVEVGDGSLHLHADHRDDEGRVMYRYVVQSPNGTLDEGTDLGSGVGEDVNYVKAMEALVGFLGSYGERYAYDMRQGELDESDPLYDLREWCYMNSDELQMLGCQLDELLNL